MGTFSALLHGLGLGKGKYKRFQGSFVVEKPFDHLTEQFELKAIGLPLKGYYGTAYKFLNAVRVDENTHMFTITLPLEEQKKIKNFDPNNIKLDDEFRFRKIDENKTEVTALINNNTTCDADYDFQEIKKFISKL